MGRLLQALKSLPTIKGKRKITGWRKKRLAFLIIFSSEIEEGAFSVTLFS